MKTSRWNTPGPKIGRPSRNWCIGSSERCTVICAAVLGDAHLAEDAFQATFLQLHLKCRQFAPDRRLRPWLFTIANNQAVDLLRRNRRHKATASLCTTPGCFGSSGGCQFTRRLRWKLPMPVPASGWRPPKIAERTRSAVETMSAKLKQVLDLVVFQGLHHSEAAQRARNSSRHR